MLLVRIIYFLLYRKKRKSLYWRAEQILNLWKLYCKGHDLYSRESVRLYSKLGVGSSNGKHLDLSKLFELFERGEFSIRDVAVELRGDDYYFLMDVYRFLILKGELLNAYRFKKSVFDWYLAISGDLQEAENKGVYCYILLENGNLERLKNEVELLREASLEFCYISWFVEYLDGNRCSFYVHDEIDKEFETLVNGKDVALVGPATSDVECSSSIDSYSVVARLNYKGKAYLSSNKGKRVDVSYYGIQHAKSIRKEIGDVFVDQDFYAVAVKNKAHRIISKMIHNNRNIFSLIWLLNSSEFNIGLNAVYDLIRFNPRLLKIYYMDLMLSKGREGGYWFNSMLSTDVAKSFVETHDPIMQYSFYKLLYDRGILQGDIRFIEVMNMGIDNYLKELQKVYFDVS